LRENAGGRKATCIQSPATTIKKKTGGIFFSSSEKRTKELRTYYAGRIAFFIPKY